MQLFFLTRHDEIFSGTSNSARIITSDSSSAVNYVVGHRYNYTGENCDRSRVACHSRAAAPTAESICAAIYRPLLTPLTAAAPARAVNLLPAGTAYHGSIGFIAPYVGAGSLGNAWVLSTDTPTAYRAQGIDLTNVYGTASLSSSLGINIYTNQESSHFQLAEVVAYNRVLSVDEIQQVEQYLACKWGLVLGRCSWPVDIPVGRCWGEPPRHACFARRVAIITTNAGASTLPFTCLPARFPTCLHLPCVTGFLAPTPCPSPLAVSRPPAVIV